MTFTHEMARLFLFEQIYRAIDIARGGKYHNS
jgi:23S rRNA pseudoU1915 N3-methylase RlmH